MRRALIPAMAALLVATVTPPLHAQLPGMSLGVGGRWASPSGDFGDAVETGYGGYFKVELGALMLGAAAEANLTRFGGEGDADGVTVFGVQAGPRVGMGLFKAGLDIGWYSEIEETGYSPNLSLSLGPLDAGAGMTFFSGGRWLYLRAGVRL